MISNQLTIENILKYLVEVTDCKEYQKTFFNQLNERPLASQSQLFRLHGFVMMTENLDDDELMELDFLKIINDYLEIESHKDLWNKKLSEDAIESILEVVERYLKHQRFDIEVKNGDIQMSREILVKIDSHISEVQDENLQELFFDCFYEIRKQKREIINDEVYLGLLLKRTGKITSFLEFFQEYLGKRQKQSFQLMNALFKGFADRLALINKAQYFNPFSLVLTYSCLANFLRKQNPKSRCFHMLLSEDYEVIFENLLSIIYKNTEHCQLGSIFKNIIDSFLKAEIAENLKFIFILNLYKNILQKASTFFCFVQTSSIGQSSNFLRWFGKNQLCTQNKKEIIEVYFSNQYAMEFLLVMMIFYLRQFPQQMDSLRNLMWTANLLEESKYFIHSESIRDFMVTFHEQTDQLESYIEFENSILDQKEVNEHMLR